MLFWSAVCGFDLPTLTETNMKLGIGDKLPVGAKFSGWVIEGVNPAPADVVEGYHLDNYFRDGKYLGPDVAGVEPAWELPETKKLTIDRNSHGKIVVRDESGNVVAERSRTCNPAALAQAICDAESVGEIDWDNSQIAKPSDDE